jgi:hypothetical protein
MFHSKFLIVVFFVMSHSYVMAQSIDTSSCEKLKKESITKLNNLVNEIKSFSDYNNNIQLATIIFPEFITFSFLQNLGEITFISINHQANNERFKTVSFGPFQMQLNFIDYYLVNSDKSNLTDTILSSYTKSNFEYLINNIYHLNKLETQWKILNLYYSTERKSLIKMIESEFMPLLIRKYNSGTSSISQNQKIFSKISCRNQTYEKWCYEINSWIDKP